MMAIDRSALAGNLIRAILKSKKLLRIYSPNNSVYLNTLDEVYNIAADYLKNYGEIVFTIKPVEILVDTEQVYHNTSKTDNFAMLFFGEGVKELRIREGLKKPELEEFIKLVGTDFAKEDLDDDMISAIWERDFENIKMIVDDLVVFEGAEMSTGEAWSGSGSGVSHGDWGRDDKGLAAGLIGIEKENEEERLQKVYRDGLEKEDAVPISAGDLSVEERAYIAAEKQQDPSGITDKLVNILMFMLYNEKVKESADKTEKAIEDMISYSLKGGSIATLLMTLRNIKQMTPKEGGGLASAPQIQQFLCSCIAPKMIKQLGHLLDFTRSIKEEEMIEYAWHFGKDAIGPLISLLGNLQTITARRIVNNVLIHVGKENINVLQERLDDPVWYVVRNIIYVLRNIGDISVLDSILRVARHENARVRLEVLKALGDFRDSRSLPVLKAYFDDSDLLVRLAAVSVFGSMATGVPQAANFVRDAIVEKISEKGFEDREFREKKAFYEAMAAVRDKGVEDSMIDIIKKKGLFGTRKQAETRACAAHYLGVAESREALPFLEKLAGSSDPLVAEHAAASVQRIRNG
jgi:hypothetical protein